MEEPRRIIQEKSSLAVEGEPILNPSDDDNEEEEEEIKSSFPRSKSGVFSSSRWRRGDFGRVLGLPQIRVLSCFGIGASFSLLL